MAELPYLKFYTSDWLGSTSLRRVSLAAKGVWCDMLCLMWGCEPQGTLSTNGKPWSMEDLIEALHGHPMTLRRCIMELIDKGVADRDETGMIFSRRMMRDIRKADAKRLAGSKGGNPMLRPLLVNQEDNQLVNEEVKQTVGMVMELGLVSSPNSERARKKSDDDPPGFLEFWAEYPGNRKAAKAQCARKWATIDPDAFSEVMAGLARWKASADWAKDSGQFIPAPLVWLNQARWTATPMAAGRAAKEQSSVSQMLAEMNFEETK